jgi:DNA-binding MarR family transcriptional regulator
MNMPLERLLIETRRVYQAFDEVAGADCTTLGLTSQECALLMLLDRPRRAADVDRIARTALVPRTQLIEALRRLQARGCVDLQTPGAATGPHAAILTAIGRELCRQLEARDRALMQRLAAAVDAGALHATFATLRNVRRLLQREGVAIDSPCAT